MHVGPGVEEYASDTYKTVGKTHTRPRCEYPTGTKQIQSNGNQDCPAQLTNLCVFPTGVNRMYCCIGILQYRALASFSLSMKPSPLHPLLLLLIPLSLPQTGQALPRRLPNQASKMFALSLSFPMTATPTHLLPPPSPSVSSAPKSVSTTPTPKRKP